MTDFEDILTQIGGFGRYQKFIYFFCVCILRFNSPFNFMSIVFLAASPNHWCEVPSAKHLNISHDVLMNLTIPLAEDEVSYSKCARYDIDYSNWTETEVVTALEQGSTKDAPISYCKDGWVYDTSVYQSSITTEWDLVCDRHYLAPIAASVFMAGLMTGSLGFGLISDRFGRRKSWGLSMLISVIAGVLSVISVNYEMFLFSRFVLGAGTIGNVLTAYVLAVELVSLQWRVFVGMCTSYFWCIYLILLAGIAYLVRTWRTLAMIIYLPQILTLLAFFIIPESPRWLYAQNRHEEAKKIVRKIAKSNGAELPEKLQVEVKGNPSSGVFLDLIRNRQLRWRLLNVCFQWFTASIVYYGLSLGSSNLGGNHYVNFVIGALMEVLSYLTVHISIQYLGRKKVYAFFIFLSAAVLLVMPLIPRGMTLAEIGLPMAGRYFISGAFMVIYFYTAEVFPTVVRNVSMSAGSFTARIGGIIAPFLASLIGVSRLIPYLSFGFIALAAGFLSILLPESKGEKLPERIEDADIYTRKKYDVSAVDGENQELEDKGENTA